MSSRTNLIALVGLVLVANGMALWSAVRNRTGAYREMELGRSELIVRPTSRDRSTVELSILESGCQHSDDWLDDAKMQTLGFKPVRSQEDRHQLPRMVWAAIELGGPAYERCAAFSSSKNLPVPQSRLMVIDADRSARTLEARYPGRNRYWIVRAHAAPSFLRDGRRGTLALQVPSFNVPREFTDLFRDWPTRTDDVRVTVQIGSRYEPWFVSARRADTITPKE